MLDEIGTPKKTKSRPRSACENPKILKNSFLGGHLMTANSSQHPDITNYTLGSLAENTRLTGINVLTRRALSMLGRSWCFRWIDGKYCLYRELDQHEIVIRYRAGKRPKADVYVFFKSTGEIVGKYTGIDFRPLDISHLGHTLVHEYSTDE